MTERQQRQQRRDTMMTSFCVKPGTEGRLTGVYTGFPTGKDRCIYLGVINGYHAFRCIYGHGPAYIPREMEDKICFEVIDGEG